MVAKKTAPAFQLGDRVTVRHWPEWRGRIVELRGPLGPGGVQIYRVRFPGEPKPDYIELREDQLILIPPKDGASSK
ncbi:MAG TPA: hypothetical protein VFW33_11320 [Gemmataceae bacterium]|nr:hypothetical protein [Gemmataceae bacterium]